MKRAALLEKHASKRHKEVEDLARQALVVFAESLLRLSNPTESESSCESESVSDSSSESEFESESDAEPDLRLGSIVAIRGPNSRCKWFGKILDKRDNKLFVEWNRQLESGEFALWGKSPYPPQEWVDVETVY